MGSKTGPFIASAAIQIQPRSRVTRRCARWAGGSQCRSVSPPNPQLALLMAGSKRPRTDWARKLTCPPRYRRVLKHRARLLMIHACCPHWSGSGIKRRFQTLSPFPGMFLFHLEPPPLGQQPICTSQCWGTPGQCLMGTGGSEYRQEQSLLAPFSPVLPGWQSQGHPSSRALLPFVPAARAAVFRHGPRRVKDGTGHPPEERGRVRGGHMPGR